MGSEKVVGFTDEEMESLEAQEQSDKVGFTDDEIEAMESGEKYPGWRSALAGAEEIGLMGLGPNIRAAVKTGSFSSPEYISERDQMNAENEEMKQEDPNSFLAGQIGGGAASLLVPVGAAAQGTKLGARVATAAVMGAGLGAASDTPDVSGQVTSPLSKEDLKERGKNAIVGGIIGPVAELGTSFVRAITPDEINRAFSALQPPKAARREARLAGESGGLSTKQNIVNFAKSEGMLDGIPNTEEIYKKSLAAKEKYGDALNTIYRRSQEVINDKLHEGFGSEQVKYYASMADIDTIRSKVVQEIRSKKWADAEKDSAIKQLGDYFEGLKKEIGTDPDLLQLHDIKTAIGSKSFKEGRAELPTSTEEFWRTAGRVVDDEIKKRVDGLASLAGQSNDKALGEMLREANKRYSLASDIYSITGDAVDSAAGRLPRDLGDIFGHAIRSPELQVGLSKVGRVNAAIPQALKPTGPQFALPIQQIINDATRLPSPNEIYNQRMQNTPSRMDQASMMLEQAWQAGVPPHIIDQKIKESNMSNIEKAKLRNKNTKMSK